MTTPRTSHRATFRAIGTVHEIVVTDPAALAPALATTLAYLAELDRAASRFRPDSEVSALARLAADGPATTFVSDLLEDHLRAAGHASRLTGGLVDPTVGRAVVAEGYDADIDEVRTRARMTAPRADVPGWRSVRLYGGQVSIAAGTLLDLGASAKAHAADVVAGRLARSLPGGFLVNLGGDVAASGELPAGGWQVAVEDADGTVVQVVTGTGQAFATSSSRRRSWDTDRGRRHHVVDPRTGHSARTPWSQVTAAGVSALEANAASTAALLLGEQAPAWLEQHRVPARLDHLDGSVTTTHHWPHPDRRASAA